MPIAERIKRWEDKEVYIKRSGKRWWAFCLNWNCICYLLPFGFSHTMLQGPTLFPTAEACEAAVQTAFAARVTQ